MSTEVILHPGVHFDVSEAAYHRLPFASNSLMTELNRSPAHCLLAIRGEGREPTPAMKLGSAIHTRVLQPDRFASSWGFYPHARRSADSKAQFDALADQFGGEDRIITNQDDWDAIELAAQSIQKHPAAGPILHLADQREVTIVFDWDGVRCKARIDACNLDGVVVVDLKTSTDASPREFSSKIFNRGYHRQAAFYREAVKSLGTEVSAFLFVAQEVKTPHLTVVYQLTTDAIEQGRRELLGLLALYRDCKQRGEWPGYSDEILNISLPAWAQKLGTTTEEVQL